MIAARYIFGHNKISGVVTQLSAKTKGLASGLLSNPHSMENVIGLVRTAAPLTSDKTVTKINTYLPAFEKISTLLGMYSFLNRAQNYAPIQSLNAKTPMEKVSSLISSGNIPIGKILAQPLIANNMDKIMSSLAKGVINNGNINDMLSSMAKQFANNKNSDSSSANNANNVDLSSLIETFMPLINNVLSDNSSASNKKEEETRENKESQQPIKYDNNVEYQEEEQNLQGNTATPIINESPRKVVQRNTPINIRHRRRKTT